MKIKFYCLLFFVTLFVTGCGPKELSSEELLTALKSAGYNIEKGARIHHSLEGAREAFWIKIDGVRVSAYRLSTTARANMKVRTFTDGLCVGYWVFEYVDSLTADKIKNALEE